MARSTGIRNATEKTASSTVLKALRVLNVLADLNEANPEGASVSEIARSSGEHASSVCKYLAAFQQEGLVDQDPHTDRYRIGPAALKYASIVMKHFRLREFASPYLRKLSELTGETVHLVVRRGTKVVYIDKVESPKRIRMHSEIGMHNPLYCTGVGKSLLAFSPPALVDEVVAEGLHPFTPRTITTRERLLEELAKIRKQGYAVDDEEHEPDVFCVAAPIFDHRDEPIASISITVPKWRLNEERVAEMAKLVVEATADISRELGHNPQTRKSDGRRPQAR
jgi:DNA-binding IclR family transcriptional regulator